MTDEILHLDETSGKTEPTNNETANTTPAAETAAKTESTVVPAQPESLEDAVVIEKSTPIATSPVITVNSSQATTAPAAEPAAAPAKKSKKILWTSLIVLGGIVLFTAIYFLIFPNQWKSLIGKKAVDTEIVDETDIVTDDAANKTAVGEDSKKANEEVKSEANANEESEKDVKADAGKSAKADAGKDAKANTENASKDTKVTKETPKTTPEKETPSKNATGSNWGLKLPANVISYGSFKEEATAKAEVEKLKGQNLKASYFLMSDLQKGKPALYKVYVGPFANAKEAKAKLDAVKKVSDKAFIEVIK